MCPTPRPPALLKPSSGLDQTKREAAGLPDFKPALPEPQLLLISGLPTDPFELYWKNGNNINNYSPERVERIEEEDIQNIKSRIWHTIGGVLLKEQLCEKGVVDAH